MEFNLFEVRQQLLHRQKQIITKIEIKYLKQMNQLLRDKESSIKKVKSMFKRDIRIIEQVIYSQQTAPKTTATATTNNHNNHSSSSGINLQATAESTRNTTTNNNNTDTGNSLQFLSEQQILHLLQECASMPSATTTDTNTANTVNSNNLSSNTPQRSRPRHPRMNSSPSTLSSSIEGNCNSAQLSTMSSTNSQTSSTHDATAAGSGIVFSINSIIARHETATDEQHARSQQRAAHDKDKNEARSLHPNSAKPSSYSSHHTQRITGMLTSTSSSSRDTSLSGESKPEVVRTNNREVKQETSKSRLTENNEEDERIHQCQVCGQYFAKRSTLSTHIASAHKGFRPFQCNVCGKMFITHSEFQTHVRHKHGIQATQQQ